MASCGYDAMSKAVFYGLEGHLRVCWPGVIVAGSLAPANVHDRWVVESDLLPGEEGGGGVGEGDFVVGDTNYSSPILKEDLGGYGVAQKDRQKARAPPLAAMVDQREAAHRDGDRPTG